MPSTADNLRELHGLHQRAKALRDHLASGPKTLAARQAALASRKTALEQAKKDHKDSKAQTKLKETQVQSITGKVDDLRVKLNAARKQDEYNAIVSQISADNKTVARLEGEILEAMERHDAQAAELAKQEAEVAKLAEDAEALRRDIESKATDQRGQLATLEKAIVEAETILPEDQRDQYRRVVKQRGADALAPAEGGACSGCFLSLTAQMTNELINGGHLVFCKSCGRVLYLAEEDMPNLRRTGR